MVTKRRWQEKKQRLYDMCKITGDEIVNVFKPIGCQLFETKTE